MRAATLLAIGVSRPIYHFVIHKECGKNNPRMMVSMTTSKTIERLHIPMQPHNPNRQWQSATHNGLKRGDPVE